MHVQQRLALISTGYRDCLVQKDDFMKNKKPFSPTSMKLFRKVKTHAAVEGMTTEPSSMGSVQKLWLEVHEGNPRKVTTHTQQRRPGGGGGLLVTKETRMIQAAKSIFHKRQNKTEDCCC